MLPEMVVRLPELALTVNGVALAFAVLLPLAVAETERVVRVGTPTVVVAALTVAGAVPCTSTAEEVDVPETVTNWT